MAVLLSDLWGPKFALMKRISRERARTLQLSTSEPFLSVNRDTREPRIVIVHDYLNQRGGAEKVVGVLHKMFPHAPIYTSIVDRNHLWSDLKDADIRTSFMQRLPFVHRKFKWFFWLYPVAFRMMSLPDCDVVISSSSAYAKGVKLPKESRPIHICYCHTPMRFAWNFEEYIRYETPSKILKIIARCIVPLLKRWDKANVKQVDLFIANSRAVQQRIQRIYNREALVLHPPVDLPQRLVRQQEGYFLILSRLVSYKRLDLAVEACTRAGFPLVVIGDGPDRARLESISGANVKFLGFQSQEVIVEHLARCKALIFPGEEDFGITPVEAHAQGRPVVAYRAGGALDTVIEGVNGLFFDEQSPDRVVEALRKVDDYDWDPDVIRQSAERFSRERFEARLKEIVAQVVFEGRYKLQSLNLPIEANGKEIAQ
jgi:glycosyltransferase involved in cell wall biosynthesis